MSNSMKTPPAAAAYFGQHPLLAAGPTLGHREAHPVIVAAYTPQKGWKRYGYNKRISGAWARKMRSEGITAVTLQVGEVRADFQVKELTR